ncbi:MAG: FRG domain-containing protein, partial [Bryobacteraceae bacterium]
HRLSVQIVPGQNSRYPLARMRLIEFRKVLYRTLVILNMTSDGPTEGGELRSVEQAITIGAALRHCWFRGHSRVVGALSPGAHREPFCSARENIEFWAGQRFRLRASAYSSDVPGWDDHVSWLFLAQHYGVPTRLLDWTENVLAGLYFAVTGGITSEDGESLVYEPPGVELA